MKMKLLEKLKDRMDKNNILKMSDMEIQFCANNDDAHSPSAKFLPIMMHMCPPNFSTVDYFEVNSLLNINSDCTYLEIHLSTKCYM